MGEFCTREIDSTPPATAICMPSTTISLAAVAMAVKPEAHCLSTLIAAIDVGKPARMALCRAIFDPLEPCCKAHPMMTSSISAGPISARPTAWAIACPPSVGAEVLLNAPLYALAMGVRATETMTASRINVALVKIQLPRYRKRQRLAAAAARPRVGAALPLQLEATDLIAMNLIGPIGQPQEPRGRIGGGEKMIIAGSAAAERLNRPVDDLACHGRGRDLDHGNLIASRLVPYRIHHPCCLQRQQAALINHDSRLSDPLQGHRLLGQRLSKGPA